MGTIYICWLKNGYICINITINFDELGGHDLPLASTNFYHRLLDLSAKQKCIIGVGWDLDCSKKQSGLYQKG
jgi:hypothetical protein